MMEWLNPTPALFIDKAQRVRVRAVDGDDGHPTWLVEEKHDADWTGVRPFALLPDALEWARLSYTVKEPKIA